jgi:hypothetical protein
MVGEIIPEWWATSSGISTQGKGMGSTVPRGRLGLKDGMEADFVFGDVAAAF